MVLIQLKDICKKYKLGEVEVHALAGVSLDIERGEYLALMGSVGIGQIDVDEHAGMHRPPDQRQLFARRRRGR